MEFWCLRCEEARPSGYCPRCGSLARRAQGAEGLARLTECYERAKARYPALAAQDPGLAVLMMEPHCREAEAAAS